MKQYEPSKALENRIESLMPSIVVISTQQERFTTIQELLFQVARKLVKLAPEGRELEMALTKLEEANMWMRTAIQKET